MSSPQGEVKARFIDLLSSFLQRFRIVFLIVLAALLAAVIAYFIWSEWQQRARERSTLWAENAQALYQKWLEEPDTSKKKDLAAELNELLERILSRYPRQYGAQRALFIGAGMAYEQKDWAKAADAYLALAKRFPRSYLAQLGLLYGGVCFEEMDEIPKALSAYAQIISRYKDSLQRPRALFSTGRLLELQQDFAGAKKAYDQLDDEYPLSSWTKAARNRLIDLKIKGRISE
ncbi:MAG: tetratricopeptide repeat protein [candidate division WOR-3 bacterium]